MGKIPKSRNEITTIIEDAISRKAEVEGRIENALAAEATIVLTSTAAGALAAAIAAAVDGDVIEVQSNAAYSPIVLPADKVLTIRSGFGYGPRLTGTRCIQLADGASGHLVSGFSFESYTTSNPNYQGAAIDFEVKNAKISDCIFHNMNFGEVTAGSAVMLSYHWSEDGDNYANPPQPYELSDTISFVDCRFWKAGAEGTEGAALSLRSFAHPMLLRVSIEGQAANSRGIQLQNCTDILADDCAIHSFTGNGEGIKIDSIGTPVAVRENGLITNCKVRGCVEGIDVDDNADMVVIDNVCYDNTDEGISIDDSSKCFCSGNVCFNNGVGILAEAGSVTELECNACFGNTTDYSILNGYSLPSSNTTGLDTAKKLVFASGVPYEVAASGDWSGDPVTVKNAVDRIASAVAGLLATPIP